MHCYFHHEPDFRRDMCGIVGVVMAVVMACMVLVAAAVVAAAGAVAGVGVGDPEDEAVVLQDTVGKGVTQVNGGTSGFPALQGNNEEQVLQQLLKAAVSKPFTGAANNTQGQEDSQHQVGWRCLMAWIKAHDRHVSQGQPTCHNHTNTSSRDLQLNKCAPLLFLVFPTLCNGTQSCVNVTQSSLEELLHRYWTWQRRKKQTEEADDAVIYIVVVLAFYSFGIVFMMANFVRQEQRELEETKVYKQYVKLARDRWLTTRGNLTNKLALQALNTFNAVPQTTDANKVTFV
ncbi:hypothetical protein Pmani_007219 [Petrolisthes manimaculis]|uniref:Uncharacterized protein n=1 Tax=Petrolisthes manimaculis TaxID=1843537 RepID=A0AAE1QBC5_9EUCA|nr:hypothetical protein Pmani_007219 [Petrolisthes manimaculis]